MKTSDDVARLVEAELRRVRDVEAEMRIRATLVRPYPVERDWAYGKAGDQITCWTVAEGVDAGMGSEWFRSLEEAAKRSIG